MRRAGWPSILVAWLALVSAPVTAAPGCPRWWSRLARAVVDHPQIAAIRDGILLLLGGGAVVLFWREGNGPPQPISLDQLPVLPPELVKSCVEKEMEAYRRESPLVNYATDGCYLRAGELIERIQKNCLASLKQIWISGSLKPCASVQWEWHTAGCFRGADGKVYIVDPAFSTEVIALDVWKSTCQGEFGEVRDQKISECGGPTLTIHGKFRQSEVDKLRCHYTCYGSLATAYEACRAREGDAECPARALQTCRSCRAACPRVWGASHSCNDVPTEGYQLPHP